jgi:hypothetical protein
MVRPNSIQLNQVGPVLYLEHNSPSSEVKVKLTFAQKQVEENRLHRAENILILR